MIETITIITLSLLALAFFRPGKTPPLPSPLTINRIGQFHAVLAPKINLAQPLVESISAHLSAQDRKAGNIAPRYFTVQDKAVKAHGADFYLLAVTLRDGILYCQATSAKNDDSNLETIRTFSEEDLLHFPASQAAAEVDDALLMSAINAAANQRGAVIAQITQ